MQTKRSRASGGQMRTNLLVGFVLVAAVTAIYAQTTHFGLVRFDDAKYVSGSVYLEEGLSAEGVWWAFSRPFASNYFPLTLMSHMADSSLFGSAYGGHHFSSVAIHALNSLLLFFALMYMTGARAPSAIVAALFAVHPLNVESVAWVAERKNVLSTTFWILSMLGYCVYARRGGAFRYLGVALLLMAGLLSKPMLVTLPLVFLLLDYWPLRRIQWGVHDAGSAVSPCAPRSIGFLVLEKLPLLTLSVASSWLTLRVQRSTVQASEAIEWAERLANATVAYARYLGKLIWPSQLTMHYPHPYAPTAGGEGIELWQIGCSAVLLVALSVVATRRRYLTVGWLWFVGTLVPTIGIVQVGSQALADRYAYVPSIGIFIAIVWAGVEWLARVPNRACWMAGRIAVGAGLLAFGVAAHQQTRYWQDSVSLFERVLEVIPRNPKIRYNLANEYRARGQQEVAIRHYRIALETDPDSVNTRINLANSLMSNDELEAAVEMYRLALARESDNAAAHNNLGAAQLAQGRIDDAIVSLERAIAIEPLRINARITLGDALRERGDSESAVEHYMNAIQAGSNRAATWRKLGESLVAAGRAENAIEVYRQAVVLLPTDAPLHNDLGELLAERGEHDAAVAAYRDALRADPGFDPAKLNLEAAELYLERTRREPARSGE